MNNEALILDTLREISARLDNVDKRLDNVDKHLEAVDKRLETVEKHLETVDEHLEQIDARLDAIEETQEEHTTALNELIRWADDAQVVVKIPFAQTKEK